MTDFTHSLEMPQTEAELKAAIEQCFARMEQARRQMEQDQIEIDRLKATTRAILNRMRAA